MFFILTYIFQLTYGFAVTLPKFSMLALYKRIFGLENFRWPLIATFVACVAYLLGITFAATFICVPVDAFWDRTIPGHCLPLLPFYIGQAAVNIAIDLVLLAIPVIPIRRLNISSSQKIAVTGIFFLGTFVTVCSAIRLHSLVVATTAPAAAQDPTYNFVGVAVWSVVETNLSVVCACLPSMRPLLRVVIHGTFRSTYGARYGYSSQLESGHRASGMIQPSSRAAERPAPPARTWSDRVAVVERPAILSRTMSQRSNATERANKWWRANNSDLEPDNGIEKYPMAPIPAAQRHGRKASLTNWRPNCPRARAAIDAIAGPSTSPIAEVPERDSSRSSWRPLYPKARPNSVNPGEEEDDYAFPERRDSVRVQSSHISRGGHDVNTAGGMFGYRYEIRAGAQDSPSGIWQNNPSHWKNRELPPEPESDASDIDMKAGEAAGRTPDRRHESEARRGSESAGFSEWERAKRKGKCLGRQVWDEWSRRGSRND